MIQIWAVPIKVRWPEQEFHPSWDDVWVVLSREDDESPATWGEFDVGHVERLSHPEVFRAWFAFIEATHQKWKDDSRS